ncbi:MAG TPA: hemolysin III family protein [Ilumatobacteraceae bacterium]|nr:hemolysin III family protein [Ilumatobacteraceae bacterium]
MPSSAVTEHALADAPAALRPALRGTLHRWSVPVAIALTAVLAVRVDTGGQLAAVLVYGACITSMLAVSGTYHARRLAHRERRLLRRLDHTMILVGTAGTYTAVIVLALDGTTRVVLLVVAWSFVVVGAAIRMLWLDAPALLIALVYLVAGWQILLDLPAYTSALDAAELTLLAVGGGLYSAGAVVYATKRPNPWPAVFGFHEVFHSFVVAAAACHWVAVLLLTR